MWQVNKSATPEREPSQQDQKLFNKWQSVVQMAALQHGECLFYYLFVVPEQKNCLLYSHTHTHNNRFVWMHKIKRTTFEWILISNRVSFHEYRLNFFIAHATLSRISATHNGGCKKTGCIEKSRVRIACDSPVNKGN